MSANNAYTPTVSSSSEAKDLGGVWREAYKHNLVGRCLGAAVLMGLNCSSRREQAPALRVLCVYRLFWSYRLLRVVADVDPYRFD